MKGSFFPNNTTTSVLYKIKSLDSRVADSRQEIITAVYTHCGKELARATPPELPLPPWGDPANQDPFENTSRDDPTTNLADMMSRETFDKAVHFLGTEKSPRPGSIPNETVKFLPKAANSAFYSLLSLHAHKALTPGLLS
jgi:hypothetical protein